jgi:SecD/SecF fusion protein
MKLKGLVWFFTIVLILVSLWELSYTWVIKSHENNVEAQARKIVKRQNPAASPADLDLLTEAKKDFILDSTKNKAIYPFFGTSYKECKKNELGLGLDLQGGMNVTLDVSLEGLIRGLSNNPKDPMLADAIRTATIQKGASNEDYISLFKKVFIQKNGAGKLSSIFAGSKSNVKPGDSDDAVMSIIKKEADGAIKQTYDVLVRRIDKFGVAQPTINLDEAKGIINVELAGVKDPVSVRNFLQSSANLQFYEVYDLTQIDANLGFSTQELGGSLNLVDSLLTNYLVSIDSSGRNLPDSQRRAPYKGKFLGLVTGIGQPYQESKTSQKVIYPGNFVYVKDTAAFNRILTYDVVKASFPADTKFLYGKIEDYDDKKFKNNVPVYAIKTNGKYKADLEGENITSANFDYDEGKPIVRMSMSSKGAKIWGDMTTRTSADNKSRSIAIVLDDIVYSAPYTNEPILGGSSQISMGNKNKADGTKEGQDLAKILQTGRIDAPAKIVAEQLVGPTLGKDAVKKGSLAFIIAFIVIFLLMLIYYNTAGWVANIALILNLLFTIGVLAALGATLTAAGIAGLVLTIGMAVDTNVIIFERIKEELTKGKTYPQAVIEGYKRSLPPVLDAHFTTFLTAFILFIFGLGPVKGFATTQMLGIFLSLFCGILVSRLVTDWFTNKNRHFNYFTPISRRVFKHAKFKFIEYRKVAYTISIFVLLAGIGSFINGFELGVEFKGGRSYTVQLNKAVNPDEVRNELKAAFGDYPVIKTVGSKNELNITTSYLKGVDNADSAVQTKLYEGLKKVLPPNLSYADFIAKKYIQGSATVQPSISTDLKKGAIKAAIFAMLIIIIYIFIRFRDWRYSFGTIVALLHDVLVTLAVFSFFKNIVPFPLEIDQHFIAAVLTVIGFSMNDTVIVFDRIREYSKGSKASEKGNIINRAINDTLSRTVMTSLTVFLTILILFLIGGEVTKGFAFAMLIGVVTGTYSSIFVAAPILVDFAKNKPLGEAEIISSDKPVAKKI